MNRPFRQVVIMLLGICGLASCHNVTTVTPSEVASERVRDPDPILPIYEVLRTTGPIQIDGRAEESDWDRAGAVEFIFPWNDVEKEGKQGTVARMLWDDSNLYIVYVCEDPYLHSEVVDHDGPVYEEDAVEIFATPNPNDLTAYYGYEMNINGALLDYIAFDAGEHRTESIHFGWQSEGVLIATTYDGTLNKHEDIDTGWVLEIAIPFDNFRNLSGQIPPEEGDLWRINLNRTKGDLGQFSQWSDTRAEVPSFHHSHFFGRVYFSHK